MKIKIKPKYSGKKSIKFWDTVNSLKNKADKQEVYSLGVALQNLEEHVLKALNEAK